MKVIRKFTMNPLFLAAVTFLLLESVVSQQEQPAQDQPSAISHDEENIPSMSLPSHPADFPEKASPAVPSEPVLTPHHASESERNPDLAKEGSQPSVPPQKERVSPLTALFRFLFGNRRRGDQQQVDANVGDKQPRIGTLANKPQVSFQELNQLFTVQLPGGTGNRFSSLTNQPRVATVTLGPATGQTVQGRVIFFQENVIQSVSLHGTIVGLGPSLVTSAASYKLEIRSSHDVGCTNLGPLFNPTGIDQGGIITAATGTSTNGFWNFYTTALPIYRISLYDPNSILGHTLLLSQNNVNLACGRILAT